MKRWLKIALVLVGLLLLSQTPFIYRRYQLGRLSAMIAELNSQRTAPDETDAYTDYKGVIHVHSSLGGHSAGSFADIIQAATSNGLAFVIMTEHPSGDFDTAEMTLRGVKRGILFINGNEINAANRDRLLVFPGSAPVNSAHSESTPDTISQAKRDGQLVFIAYPEQFRSWGATGYDGIEVYNLYTNARKIHYLTLFLDGLWSYRSYPALLWTRFYERPDENLKKWDELTASANQKIVAMAGNDAHANIGISLQEATGKKLFGIQLDPYERSFAIVRNHVLLSRDQSLTPETLLAALRDGHSYISFDLLCDGSGFRYTAENSREKKIMGDEITLDGAVRLTVTTPVKSRIVFFRNGQIIKEERETSRAELRAAEKGVYRVEAYLDRLPAPLNDKPWIISNPVYVR